VRALGDAAALVVLNNGETPASITLDVPELAGCTLRSMPLPGDDAAVTLTPAAGTYGVTLPARTGRVFTP
jgi:hypothetical protein